MKILVLSDSHGALGFMRRCIQAVKPDAVIHLGDYYEDGQRMHEEFPHIPMHQVPGNCDHYQVPQELPEILNYSVCGVELYMTHGHRHWVKMGTQKLCWDARKTGAQAVLYGHTHTAECAQEDGLWILNPGSCSGFNDSVGLIETENGRIRCCRILRESDLEEFE